MSEKEKVKTADVLASLRTRYDSSKGAWVHASEVSNVTGFDANRRCDFMAVGCWKSVGLELHGMEIKVSRNDWQKELQDITKAETFAKHCHRWWLVFANKAAKLEEVPSDWGVLEHTGSCLKVRRQAAKRTPEELHWPFLVSLMRSIGQQYSSDSVIASERKRAYEEGKAYAKSMMKPKTYEEGKYLEVLNELNKMKDVLGFDSWDKSAANIKKIKAAMEFLRSKGDRWQQYAVDNLDRVIRESQKAIDIVNGVSMEDAA